MNEFLCPTNWHRLQLISFLIQNKNAEKQNSMVMVSQSISEEKFNTAVYTTEMMTHQLYCLMQRQAKQYREILNGS